MYDQYTIARIIRLLRQGYRRVAIASLCSVSVSTVNNVANGKVSLDRPPKQDRQKDFGARRGKKKAAGLCRVHRCYRPCVACLAVQFRREHPERKWVDPPPPLVDRRIEQDIQELWRRINQTDEYVNRGLE